MPKFHSTSDFPTMLSLDAALMAAAAATATGPFKLAIWGQSEDDLMMAAFYDQLAAEPLVAQDRVTFWRHDRTNGGAAGVESLAVNDAAVTAGTVTGPMVALANVFMRHLPGREIILVMHTQAGTGVQELMDDSYAGFGRLWADDLALHEAATADGVPVQYLWHSWFAAPGSYAEAYGEAFAAFLFGRDLTGAALSYSEAAPFVLGDIAISHTLRDLYGDAITVVPCAGAHRFSPAVDLQSATLDAAGNAYVSYSSKQACTTSWRALVASSAFAGRFAALTFNLNAYANGYDDGAGGWTDSAHPARDVEGGMINRARMIGHAVLRGIGVTSWAIPAFDMCAWQSDGSYVEVWSTAGEITTTRIARGEAALDESFAHWTEVMGWQIDGAPAQRAEIVAGRVRIYPNDGGSFTDATLLGFGEGGASGMLENPEDYQNEIWKNFPIVDVGLSDLLGVPLRHLPDPAVLASTIPGNPSFTTTDAGPSFLDPAMIGSGVTGFTAHLVGAPDFSGSNGSPLLVSVSDGVLTVEYFTSSGLLRIGLRDADGSYPALASTTAPAGTLSDGVEAAITVSLDHVAELLRVWVDDVLVFDESFVSVSGVLNETRFIGFLDDAVGTWKELTAWKEATSDGTLPSGDPYVQITGPAATANAHPWKTGDDAAA
ncbi:hypothetical protein [Salipiger sp. PrR002]|uniref:hypothetical protein n=1 Tax=Salipiger sp. PrR002 TaxID=2706489 RepID=UPI0013BDEFA6|nr:hypothetical protein [Salipiger sp. PrR002]NDW00051.1 hypothetical protein [Salipiger sp. PrR002]NDW56940.1 hypothetical protein [Salipiger sp. PrR004]